ncbi:hypothetical protein M2161_004769 [Streptomyces sp. SAI-133]|nr:hypothetical protein [Streptomyces sp. SAI-133]
MLAVDAEAGPVVLAHRVHGGRVVDGVPPVLVGLGAHLFGRGRVPGVRVGVDDAFGGLGRLAEEEPVPPARGETGVAAAQGLPDGDRVQHADGGHGLGVVEGEAGRHVRAPVVTDHREPFVPEPAHHREAVAGHGALGVRTVFGVGGGLVGAAVPAQIGADDGVARRHQQRGDAVPGGVRTGVTVQEQHRGAAAAVPHP